MVSQTGDITVDATVKSTSTQTTKGKKTKTKNKLNI